jgi:hypothetical protein
MPELLIFQVVQITFYQVFQWLRTSVTSSRVKPSITLATWEVREIGRKSSSINLSVDIFAIGITNERFSKAGKTHWRRELLYKSDITGASSKANVFRILLGILSEGIFPYLKHYDIKISGNMLVSIVANDCTPMLKDLPVSPIQSMSHLLHEML